MNDCILLRYGEIALKSHRTRPKFERLYRKSIADALGRTGIAFTLKNHGARYVVFCDDIESAVLVLQRIPGIQSLSPSKSIIFSSKEELISKTREIAQPIIQGRTYCVRARRTGNHDFSSIELEREIGAAIEGKVNLTSPEKKIFVEVRDDTAYLYTEVIEGIGGMPPGSSGNILCMFSGGIDSPVAAFQMMKRGCTADFIFFNPAGKEHLDSVAKVYNFLIANYAFGYTPKLFVVEGKELVKQLGKVEESYRQVAYKVLLYTVAKSVAESKGYSAIATGEALAQKSTQTLESLMFIDGIANAPVLRPLIGMDKVEITRIASRIGTLLASQKVKEYCNISSGPVVTAPRDREKIPELSIEAEIREFRGIVPVEEEPIMLPKLNGIITIDVRPAYIQKNSDIGTDLKIPWNNALDAEYSPEKSYLLVCDFGVHSENVSEKLRRKGIKAAGITTQSFTKHFAGLKKTAEQEIEA